MTGESEGQAGPEIGPRVGDGAGPEMVPGVNSKAGSSFEAKLGPGLAAGTDLTSGSARPVTRRHRAAFAPQRPSRALLRFFDLYLYLFVRRHFHALRLAGAEHWPRGTRPLIVCLNHPSWWDPLTSILLSRFLERTADHYAPMDALAFSRYGVLEKLGLFPVEQGTARGAAQFLRSASQLFTDQNAVLWVTPQGGFTDVRTRPLAFRAGVDALIRRAREVTVLPLAIEYTFWEERLPEALALLGQPLLFRGGRLAGVAREERPAGREAAVGAGAAVQRASPGAEVAAALERAQDALSVLSRERDASRFVPVLAGRNGTSGIYGGWQRLRALVRRERFSGEHSSLNHPTGSSSDG